MPSDSVASLRAETGLSQADPPNSVVVSPLPEQPARWLTEHRSEIMEEWVDRVADLSLSYRRRPRAELVEIVTEAFEANLEALSSGRPQRVEMPICHA